MSWIYWLFDFWSIIVCGTVFAVLFVLLWHFLGWRFSLPIGAIGAAIVIFMAGRKIERDNQRKYVQDIQDKRKRSYDKIDSRNTGASDVAKRLRDRSY